MVPRVWTLPTALPYGEYLTVVIVDLTEASGTDGFHFCIGCSELQGYVFPFVRDLGGNFIHQLRQ